MRNQQDMPASSDQTAQNQARTDAQIGTPETHDGSQCVLIPLSNGGHAIVDRDAPAIVFQIRWCRMVNGKIQYAHGRYSKKLGGHGRTLKMHRLIMGEPSSPIDHINGDGLDNRQSNLQLITVSRNLMKSVKAMKGGASYDKASGKWLARHRRDRRLVNLGRFDTKEAALAAVKASREAAWDASPFVCPEFTPPSARHP